MPEIFTGNFLLFEFIFAPNNFNGSVTLEKSLFERLLSPTIVISFFVSTSKPNSNLANVPELPALIFNLFFILKLFKPKEFIKYVLPFFL